MKKQPMKKLRLILTATVVTTFVALGFTGVAGAQVLDYTPVVCTDGQVVVNNQCVASEDTGRGDDDGSASVSGGTASSGTASGANESATAVSAAGTLPYTGSNSLPLAEIGVGLLAAGGLMVVLMRRRQVADES